MKELFALLLELSCTEIHLTLNNASVTFWVGTYGCTNTISAPDVDSLVRELKKYVEEAK